MSNSGTPFEVNLLQSLDVDRVRKDIYSFGDTSAPLNRNTGIERNGGVQNLHLKEQIYGETGYHYLTEDGRVLSAEDNPGTDYKIIKVDGKSLGQVSKYGVESRAVIDGYDDVALTADGDLIAIRINQTTVTIFRLALDGSVITSRSVSFSGLTGLVAYFSSLSLVRYQSMHYADSQEFALRMGTNVVILKESTPSQFVPIGIGGGAGSLFPGGGNLAALGTYRGFIIFASSNGKVSSFDGESFRLSDGSGVGIGPFNNATAVGTDNITSIIQYDPSADEHYLVITGGPNSRVASWDGIAWKNYDGTGAGNGPFNNGTAIPAGVPSGIFGSAIYNTVYYVIYGISGRVASWTAGAWKNYDGTGSGAGPFDNGTAIGTSVIRKAVQYSTRLAVVGDAGRVGSWSGTAWTVYTAGSGLSNNATVVGAQNILFAAVFGTLLFVTSASGRVGTWDGTAWKNYDGTGTGTGPSSNAAVVGTDQINTVSPLGTTLVFFGFNNSRIGSWDGTAWKNYDGTGTGTGIFSAAIPGASAPVVSIAGTFNGRNVIVFGGISIYTYVDGANNFGPIYQTGVAGAEVSRILQNSSLDGYLYAYRYENSQYLMQITGNSTNKTYLVDPAASPKQSRNFNGRFALPQVSAGFTRHIVIETPRIDTVPAIDTIRALSLVGYTNFLSFSTSQVYPENDTTNVNDINISAIGPVIGFGYADVTYRTTASGTDIQELYLPPPLPAPTSFNRISKSNTATNVNGYGKINNMLGRPTTKPFEFRNLFINGQQAALSVAMIDGLPTDAMGVLITNVGEFDDTYTPMIVDDDKILYRFNNRFFVVKIGTNIPNFFDKITADLYKLNTIHPANLYSDRDTVLYASSMDYHGQAFFLSSAVPSATATLVANIINTPYSNSIDVGDKLVQISSFGVANLEVFGQRLPSAYGVQPPFAVDTYVNDEYAFSTQSDGTEFVDPAKVDLLYIPDTRVPVAIGADYQGSVAIVGGVTIILSPDYDGYLIGNDLQGTFSAFVLYGQTYLFDGNSIYIAEIQGNVLLSTTRTAPADGLVFVAETPSEIYFLSSFDNSLYVFTGGRTLTKSKRFTATAQILQGVYSVHDNTLLLETTDSFVWIRDGIITQNDKLVSQTGVRLFFTTAGAVIGNDARNWRYTYEEEQGSVVVPLSLKTAFFGANANIMATLYEIVFVIFDIQRRKKTITITYEGYDDIRSYPQTEPIVIQPNMYTANGFARFRIQPSNQRILGAAVQYDCAEFALVQEINFYFEPGEQATLAPNRSV
jgi:hypothetical protein